jgi:hypothetical protein
MFKGDLDVSGKDAIKILTCERDSTHLMSVQEIHVQEEEE